MQGWERDTKEVYHDHAVIDERPRPDIPGWSEVAKGTSDSLQFHLAILEGNVLVSILIFTFFQITQLVQIFRSKLISEYPGTFGLR